MKKNASRTRVVPHFFSLVAWVPEKTLARSLHLTTKMMMTCRLIFVG